MFIFISRISHILSFTFSLIIPLSLFLSCFVGYSSCLSVSAVKSQWLDRIAVTAKKKKREREAIIKKERQNGGEIESNRKERQRREREREASNINKLMGQM